MLEQPRTLYLCGGLQSSGSTLVSWCFLQRPDMNGVLDAENDLLPKLSNDWGQPFTWYKTTISCFRMSELKEHYEDVGWEVRPLLVVRDVRKVWASLCGKQYGRNGITAEDPPLRLRMRRFLEDWRLFRHRSWPIIQYESFVKNPEQVLRETCGRMRLGWEDSMLSWPKPRSAIAITKHGNRTFRETRGLGLLETICPEPESYDYSVIPSLDLEWLERKFAQFNAENEYPAAVDPSEDSDREPTRAVPSFDITRRRKWELRRKPLRWLTSTLGLRSRKRYA